MNLLIAHRSMTEIGGSEIQISLLINEFVKKDIKVHIYTNNINFNKFPKLKNKRIIVLQSDNHFVGLFNVLKKNDIDVVLVRDLRKTYLYFIICKIAKIKFIASINQNIRLIPSSLPVLIKKIIISIKQSHSFPKWALETYFSLKILKYCKSVVTQTKDQQSFLESKNIRSVLIRNCHNVNRYQHWNFKRKHVIWVGNIKKIKNLEDYIRLADVLKDMNIDFICIGKKSSQAYQNFLEKKISHIPTLRYLGEKSFEETNKLIAQSLFLVSTSITEGFPNTFIQAWLLGTPVISLFIDPDNFLRSNKIGFYSGNFEKLVKHSHFLLENKDECLNMSAQCRAFAKKEFDIEKNVLNYISILS